MLDWQDPVASALLPMLLQSQLESMFELLPDSGASSADVEIASLHDLVSELALEPEESAVVLRRAAQTLQKRNQAETRSLCRPWGVRLSTKKVCGKYGKRADNILIKELTAVFMK